MPASTTSAKEGRKITIDDLTKRRQDEIERSLSTLDSLQSDIEYAQAEVEFIKGLGISLQRSEVEKVNLQEQLNNHEETISGLREANERLQSMVSQYKQRIEEVETELSLFREKAEALDNELAQVKTTREEERKEFADEIERQIKFKVDGFKGKLRTKLFPIFNNKRSTDDQQDSAELTRFLRQWFRELENELKEAGIQLTRDA
jgi:chromosome segregation ATPase